MRIVVSHVRISEDAPKDEQDTLIQAAAVAQALNNLGFESRLVPFSSDLEKSIQELRDAGPDLIFNLVESLNGSGRLIHVAPALFDYLKIPYTGASSEAIVLTSNKLLAKKLLRLAGVATADWAPAGSTIEFAGPYLLKSVWEHASIGLDDHCLASDQVELTKLLTGRASLQEVFIERYIEGREFNLSILAGRAGPRVLPPAEIRFDFPPQKARIVGYRAKWDESSFEYQHTSRSFDFGPEDRALLDKLERIALKCWRLFDLRGYARVDFRIDNEGCPWVLEINSNPCISPDSGFVAAAEKAGLNYEQMLMCVIEDGL